MSVYLLFKLIYVNVMDVALKHFQLQLDWNSESSFLSGRQISQTAN